MVHLTKFLLPVVVKAQRVGWVGGGQAKCRNRFYYTIRAKIYAYAPPLGQGGSGGQFSIKNRGRPLWKAPF